MEIATRATLYLGSNIGGRFGVTDTDFSLWLEDHVTPSFPGFTVRNTLGYWKGKPEQSRELVILGPNDGHGQANFRAQVEIIAASYKKRFHQEAVMVTYDAVSILWDVS